MLYRLTIFQLWRFGTYPISSHVYPRPVAIASAYNDNVAVVYVGDLKTNCPLAVIW